MLYMQRRGSQDISLLFQPTVIEEIVRHGGKVRTTEGKKGCFVRGVEWGRCFAFPPRVRRG